MRKFLLAMMVGSLLVHPAGAQVGGGLVFCTNCATEPTQVSVKLMHELEYAKQLLQYAIQVQQLADALKNTLHGGPASLTSIAVDLGMLAAVVQGGRALAWSLADDDVVFRETYPGYKALASVGPPPPRWHLCQPVCHLGPDEPRHDAGYPSGCRFSGKAASD